MSEPDSSLTPTVVSGEEIVLEGLTKRYPGQRESAVHDVNMTIPAGKITVFVGPSGCGKTTTMKMINRLIEPSAGRITVGGRDTLSLNADELRRGIGYAIQQAGLFPHMTVAQNVGLVPGLVGWNKARIRARVEEMLDLVGLDPDEYRHRFPRQLSGGQQQRVGVARALAADPPVLLMDEPFGAVDPITRGLLQDELLRLQDELGKTIVFVTHDFAEAIKLGDHIAVLGPQSRILQFDTPEAILANPADETVAGFVGAGASLKQLTLQRVRDVKLQQVPSAVQDAPVEELRRKVRRGAQHWAVVTDARKRPVRWINGEQLVTATDLRSGGVAIGGTVSTAATLQDALEALLAARNAAAVVTGVRGEYAGIITIDTLVSTIRILREEHEHDHDDDDDPDGGDGGDHDHDDGGGDHDGDQDAAA